MEEEKRRYVGIDLGKRAYQLAIVDRKGKVKMSNGKTTSEGRQLLYKKLTPHDKVAIEAGNLAFTMAKELETIVGCETRILNPSHLALIYGTMKKTDKEDALKLAHILEDYKNERLPLVPLPSEQEMKRRKLLGSYRREQRTRNQTINRLHGLYLAQGITDVVKSDLATGEARVETIERLNGLEREEAEHLLMSLELYEKRIKVLENQMEKESEGDEEITRLQNVPGVGPKVSFAFVSHVAHERFENSSQVSNYLGLVPRVYISGDTVRHGHITKRGNSYLRALLVQASWALIRSKKGGCLKERYKYMTEVKAISKKKAIVAIARRLAELLYTLMKNGTEYEVRKFRPEKRAEVKQLVQLAISA